MNYTRFAVSLLKTVKYYLSFNHLGKGPFNGFIFKCTRAQKYELFRFKYLYDESVNTAVTALADQFKQNSTKTFLPQNRTNPIGLFENFIFQIGVLDTYLCRF